MSLTLGKSWKVETAAVELSKKKKKRGSEMMLENWPSNSSRIRIKFVSSFCCQFTAM
jgi:hypothetical protein